MAGGWESLNNFRMGSRRRANCQGEPIMWSGLNFQPYFWLLWRQELRVELIINGWLFNQPCLHNEDFIKTQTDVFFRRASWLLSTWRWMEGGVDIPFPPPTLSYASLVGLFIHTLCSILYKPASLSFSLSPVHQSSKLIKPKEGVSWILILG